MNPGSRSGRGRRLWTVWEDGLRSAGIDFESVCTSGIGDAFRISRQSGDVDAVVAVGGDGTINEVLDGVIQSGRPDLKMGVLYSGTSPDFCRFHGIPTEPAKALACLIAGKAKKVDVARIEYTMQDGTRNTAHFGCSCNIGLGAAVARNANSMRKYLGDNLGTCVALIKAIIKSAPVSLNLEIDGARLSIEQVNNLFILKNPYIASGLKLDIGLRPSDGKLMLVCVSGQGRAELCSILPGFYTGHAIHSKAVFFEECSSIKLRSDVSQEIEFDGDPRGLLPADISLLPRALNLIGESND